MGPVASQEAIKQLGTNGGGFFNANSAHPFENPTPWTNFWSMFAIFLDPAGADLDVRADGEEAGATAGRCGRRCSCCSSPASRRRTGPRRAAIRSTRRAASTWRPRATQSGRQHGGQGGPLRHRELRALRHRHDRRLVRLPSTRCTTPSRRSAGWCRWSTSNSARWSSAASAPGSTACLMMVVLTVFIAGLMVGRTPEYLGKKIQAREVQMAMLYVLVFPVVILMLTAHLRGAARGAQGTQQLRPARTVRDPLRLHVDAGQQRQRVRRPHGDDVLLQHAVRLRHAHRPVRHDGADAGARRASSPRRRSRPSRPARSR